MLYVGMEPTFVMPVVGTSDGWFLTTIAGLSVALLLILIPSWAFAVDRVRSRQPARIERKPGREVSMGEV